MYKDDALWEVIDDGISMGICTQTEHHENGTSCYKDVSTCKAEEKANRKNDVKARAFYSGFPMKSKYFQSYSCYTINGFEVTALSAKYEGKKSVSSVTRWDTLSGNIEDQGTKKVQTNMALMAFSDSEGKPQQDDTRFIDNGCSRHMTVNIAYLSDFKEFDGGYVTCGGGAHGGRISGKGTLKTDSLDFEDVYFVNELNFNLFSVSQMCDKKNYVLFTDIECLVLSPNFKLPDESQILLKIPRKDNMYSFDMKNIVPKESLTCLVTKATSDESMLWHRRLGHINFKNINKLVKDNLVRGLPIKHFENDQTCFACLKGKQHRASCKSKVLNPITKPLFMLHMDLFGPTFMSSLMHKKYCLVVTDDYSRHVKRGRDTKIPQSSGPPVKVGDEAVHKELGDRIERAATTTSSLEAEQDSDAQTWFEAAFKQSNDPPISRVNTLRSGEDNMKLMELMAHCTKLSELVSSKE
ncbi:putative ribonuclease H-like domain-containing protein [Tanacetum coccineum]